MSQIIIRPIVTEKMTAQGENENRYGFVVAKTSNKGHQTGCRESTTPGDGVRTMIVRKGSHVYKEPDSQGRTELEKRDRDVKT